MPEFAVYASLRGRAVFVTGGATGIGAALVEHFAAQGAHVGFVDIAEAPSRALVAEIDDKGQTAPWFAPCDVRDVPDLQAAIAEFAAVAGAVTVLLNNAGHDERHAIDDVTPEFWNERLAVNLNHQFFAAQAVVPGMTAAGGGAVVNLGSIAWRLGLGGMPAYTTAKAAIEGLPRSLARDLGPVGIRVNCILPGAIITPRQKDLWLTPAFEEEILRKQSLKENLYPPDVARLALFLAADDSRMCTSQTFTVDGGWS